MFGTFEVDFRSGELRKHGTKLKLQEKPLAVLAMLLERPGEVVTRDQLRERLWSDAFVDFDHSLGVAIYKLRQVLGDTAANPRFLETVARRGYRFIAPVRQPASPSAGKTMIAVLPFENLSDDVAQEFFADGMTEEMITHLGRLNPQRLGVIARTSAMTYKRRSKSITEIGRELGVEFILEGSVRRWKTKARITAQLIQVADQTHLWAETYDRGLRDIFSIQTDVAERIAGSLAVELIPEQRALTRRSAPANSEAYDLYLKGRYIWNRRTETAATEAIELFSKAIALAPDYALPYTGVSDCYSVLGYYGALSPAEAFTRAKAAASRALELDDYLAEAHGSLAFSIFQGDWNWVAAERHHLRAIELNANYAPAHHSYGLDLTQLGRFSDAHAALQRALELDPLSVPIRAHVGRLSYFARQYARAVEELSSVVNTDPTYVPAHYFLGLTLLQTGKTTDALRELQTAERLAEGHPILISALAFAFARAGKLAQASRLADRVEAMSQTRHVSPFFVAFSRAGLGDADKTFPWLERAYAERFPWLLYIKMEPVFDDLRSDPRLTDLMQRVDPLVTAARSAAAPR